MFKKQVNVNIKDLDVRIGQLNEELLELEDSEEIEKTIKQIEQLTDIRCKLSESNKLGSIKPVVVSGLFGVASMVMVLKYEEKDIITSKAFGMVTNMFRGR